MVPQGCVPLIMVKPDVHAPTPSTDSFRVSDAAARRLREILDEQPASPTGEPALRISVEAGVQRVPAYLRWIMKVGLMIS